jgi:hypothetical protein
MEADWSRRAFAANGNADPHGHGHCPYDREPKEEVTDRPLKPARGGAITEIRTTKKGMTC